MNLEERVSVNLSPELLAFVTQVAERESRSAAGQIRHWVVTEWRKAGEQPAAPVWPPIRIAHVENTPEAIAAAKAQLAAWEREQERLRRMPDRDKTAAHEVRERELRDDIKTLRVEITMAERMTGAKP
jgi:hypothetical protein